jgi:hypothetical protein
VELIADRYEILVGRISHHFDELRRRYAVTDNVNFPFLQSQDCDGGVLAEFESQAVKIGNALAEIIRIALKDDALSRNPLHELESAGANRLLAPIGTRLLHFLLGHDIAEVDRHEMQKGRVWPRQGDNHRRVIGRRYAGKFGRLTTGNIIVPLDHAEIAAAWALGRRVDCALKRIFHIGGGNGATIVELQSRAQLEGIGEAVVRDGKTLGQIRIEFGRSGLVVHQAVKDRFDNRPVLPIIADVRIERGQVVVEGDHGGAPLFRRLCCGKGCGSHQRQGGGGRNKQSFHGVSPP